jgi:NAD(P)-dependent dehydrogenase (short-subunit alcohol dehydrogenase family)
MESAALSMQTQNPFLLTDKICLITGAASGIGLAIAELFAASGGIVLVADCNEKGAAAAVEKITGTGGKAESLVLDVSNEVACAEVAKTVLAKYGALDVLVNNAGIGHVGTILQTKSEDLDRLYSVNVRGVFNLCKQFLPAMVARKKGSIVNMASIGGIVAVRDRFAYCVTKFAVVGLTKSLALDHAQSGVRVNCICPGRVETPFVSARLKEYPDPEKAYHEMCSTQAMGRMGTPQEIAAAALYLASDGSSFVTGSELIIDGGWNAGK